MRGYIPVVDIFAGPGGLSEGFSNFETALHRRVFDVVLSIEKEKHARETLKLRTFYRLLRSDTSLKLANYFRFLRGEITLDKLYDSHRSIELKADRIAWQAELGLTSTYPREKVDQRIEEALDGVSNFVLIGGPPCQAYSIAGRSRNKNNKNYDPKQDKHQTLYKEYLQILADNNPLVFVMENVKGLISAELENERLLNMIISDLKHPSDALQKSNSRSPRYGYNLFSFVQEGPIDEKSSKSLVIRSEEYGVPQQRHRVIILGIRDDFNQINPLKLTRKNENTVESIIADLPKLRSGLSSIPDSHDRWKSEIKSIQGTNWFNELKSIDSDLHLLMSELLQDIGQEDLSRGDRFLDYECKGPLSLKQWISSRRIKGVCNHDTRSHIVSDLHRYFFASSYALLYGTSPKLDEFPTDLLPNHRNALYSLEIERKQVFSDRFRVQLANKPSTTITSHISKDGHYYIHPDPTQCRSLTVREAARLQTFSDDYYFCGSRTAQYQQVGNAVPPYLACQIAEIVYDVIVQMGVFYDSR